MPENFDGLKSVGGGLLKVVAALFVIALVLVGLIVVTCGGMVLFSR